MITSSEEEVIKAEPEVIKAEPEVKNPLNVLTYLKEKVNCKYCHIDLSEKLRIRCAECVVPFNLCGDCFSSGVELYPHTNKHSYSVVDCLHKPLFTKDWTALEDLNLLNGIDKHGLGNWKLISDAIGTKSARACDEHYWDGYMGRFGRCLPPHPVTSAAEGGSEAAPGTCTVESAGEEALLAKQLTLVNIPPPLATSSGCVDVGSVVQRFKGGSHVW